MKPPKTVTVGPYTYRISTTKADWTKYGPKKPKTHWALTNHEAGVILLHPYPGNPALTRVNLLHEVMHGCAYATGQLDVGACSEETWVTSTAPMLLDVLRTSPRLLAYLTEID